MRKIDKTVLKETLFVAAGTVLLSILMNLVFLIIGKWDVTVLLGNLLGAAGSILNFFLMGLTIQSSIGKDEKSIKTRVRFSIILREMLLFGIAVVCVLLPNVFNIIALLISYFFPRVAIMFRPKFKLPGDDDAPPAEEVTEGTEEEE